MDETLSITDLFIVSPRLTESLIKNIKCVINEQIIIAQSSAIAIMLLYFAENEFNCHFNILLPRYYIYIFLFRISYY